MYINSDHERFFDRVFGGPLSDVILKYQLPAPGKGVIGYYYTLLKNPRNTYHTYGWKYFIPNGFRDEKMSLLGADTPGFPEDVYVLVTTSESMALVQATDENWAKIRKANAQLHQEYGRVMGLTDRKISKHFALEEDTLVEEWFYFKFDPVEGKLRFWLAHPDVASEELRKHHGKSVFSQDKDLIALDDNTRLILNWTFYLPNREPLFFLNKKDMRLWMEYFWNKWRIRAYNWKNKKNPALQDATAFGDAVKACTVNLGCNHYDGACAKLEWRRVEPG